MKSTLSAKPERLLHTKLMPPRLHSALIQREDLLAQLDAGLTKKVSLVSAPTGFGKTTLISMWIASRDFASAWVMLDENDNDPTRFWTYVCSALRTFDSAVGKTTLSMLMAPQPPSFESMLTPLINDLARLNEPCVLVLEDYHFITSTEINQAVSFLIQHLPESLHLVLITRSDPELPLAILRVRDELNEINTAKLRFNQEETEAFLRTALPADLPASTINKVLHKTEGWAAGLRLFVLSLQNKSGADIERLIESFSGSDRYIADYLIPEVFESQPEDIQSFLLRTCFFSRLTGSLCDAITETNNSAATLEHLERDNLFLVQLERGGGSIWYRYNPLFAESIQFLAKQQLDEATVKLLFEKACGWYEYYGLFAEAIEAALAAKLFTRAMPLMEKFIEIHGITQLQTLDRWLENIPAQEILLHPVICFTYAQVILYSADRFAAATAARIEPFLQAAESAWRAQEHHQGLGQVLSFRAIVAWWQGDFPKAFGYARQALEELPEYDVLWRGNSLLILSYEALNDGRILEAQDQILEARALLGAAQNHYGVLAALQILSQIFCWQGELEQAEQLTQQIVTEAVGEESMLDDQGFAALSLADIAYEKNELVEAEERATRAVDLAVQRGNELLQAQATIRLAYIRAARNDFQHAKELLKPLVSGMQHPILLREIQETQTRISILSGDLLALKGWQALTSNDNDVMLNVQKEREAFTLARLRIAEGKAIEALKILKDWSTDAAENGRVRSQVTALCLEALAHYANSDLTHATKSLTEALTIGQAKGFRRVFLDEGRRMAALLQAILSTLPNRTLGLFATTLLHSFSSEMSSQLTATNSTVLIEPLSQQELRVLRLLVTGLSNADIAQELIVSTNTIKTHVKSIYRKLNVKSRDEARAVARELKLI
jgi:LuxR family transcriptional regulator, maltose regulon positive regulatory protein